MGFLLLCNFKNDRVVFFADSYIIMAKGGINPMGKARFNYVRRNERVVRNFTTRQKEIIGGYSETSPSKRELNVIINKAKELGVPGVEEGELKP